MPFASAGGIRFDPYVGRKPFHLAKAAGLSDITVSIDEYHVIAGQIEPEQRRNWAIKLQIARPAIAAALGDKAAAIALDRFLTYLDRSDTLTFSTQFTVLGRRPRMS